MQISIHLSIIDWREHVDIQKLHAIRLSFLFYATHYFASKFDF